MLEGVVVVGVDAYVGVCPVLSIDIYENRF